ncbi:MAG: GTP-binding protein [Clostridium sp.]|nr:GTP-binding protein [Clostridium sp.]
MSVKLSELKSDEMLLVGENLVVEKEDFVKEIEEHRGKEVYTTTVYRAHINAKSMLEDAISSEADNMYEDWEDDIWNDIDKEDIKELQNVVDKILKGHISYIADKRVEIDI